MVQQPGGASQISFGNYEPSPQRVRRAVEPKPWGTDEPTEAAAPQPLMQQQQMQAEQPAAAPVANEKDFQRMTLQEVRVILRQKNLNVGGSKDVLIARYFDALNAGEVNAHTVAGPGNSFFNGGEAQKGNNNYARPGGQNTGNFMTDRNSSRVLQAPGGASSICFGNENAAPSESWLPSGRRGGAQQSNSSQITF